MGDGAGVATTNVITLTSKLTVMIGKFSPELVLSTCRHTSQRPPPRLDTGVGITILCVTKHKGRYIGRVTQGAVPSQPYQAYCVQANTRISVSEVETGAEIFGCDNGIPEGQMEYMSFRLQPDPLQVTVLRFPLLIVEQRTDVSSTPLMFELVSRALRGTPSKGVVSISVDGIDTDPATCVRCAPSEGNGWRMLCVGNIEGIRCQLSKLGAVVLDGPAFGGGLPCGNTGKVDFDVAVSAK